MAKKIKIKHAALYDIFKNINEGFFDSIDDNAVQNYIGYKQDIYKSAHRRVKTAEELEEQRQKLWDQLVNKTEEKVNSIYNPNKSILSNSVYKISPRKMYKEIEVEIYDKFTGQTHTETIPAPEEIIALCEQIREAAERDSTIGILMRRFDKPIIWTLNEGVSTAASDGIRIAFNVIFAYTLIQKGKADLAELKAQGTKLKNSAATLLTIGKYWLYVYIHEVYHELYEHQKQAQRKDETADGKNHEMANVAMDAEINRDIEQQFPMFAGATKVANGVMDPDFPNEAWDDIFDEYFYKNKQMPTHEQPNDNQQQSGSSIKQHGHGSQNNQQNGQGQQSNQSDDQQNQQQKSGSGEQQDSQSGNQSSDQQSSQSGNKSGDQQSNQSGNDSDEQQGNQSQSGNSSNSAPDTSNESDEYNDAYNKELKNILDNMNGKSKNKNGKPQSLSDDQIEDIVDQMKNALGSGMSMKDLMSKCTGNDSDIDEKSAQKLAEKMSELTDLGGQSMQDAMNELNDMTQKPETETQKKAREQAQKDVADMMKNMEEAAQKQQSSEGQQSSEMQAGKGTSDIPTMTTSSKFGGSDMVSREDLAKIAEESGQPYTASELTANREQINSDYIKENLEELKNASSALGQKVENIRNKLKDYPVITNWKVKLRKYLKNQAEGDIETIRSKRTMSQDWRQDRYMPYKEREFKQDFGAADVFYLIDNSGSMWGAGFGEGIFMQIFSEIIGIEKKCNIENSALAYFSGDANMPTDLIRLWNKKTSKEKVLQMIGQTSKDQSGGTDIGGNILAVTKLKKPYYYNNGQKHTLLIVFTDGEDYGQFDKIKKLPGRIKSDVLFCLINRKASILQIMSDLHTRSGVKLANIISICTDEYSKK